MKKLLLTFHYKPSFLECIPLLSNCRNSLLFLNWNRVSSTSLYSESINDIGNSHSHADENLSLLGCYYMLTCKNYLQHSTV